jgi:DNA-binding transcriptional LysR family regulator
MKIRQIKAFLAVVQTGGVRHAANHLSLTPSTVAKAISQLEQELGCPLFERGAFGLRLNSAGRALLPYAETIAANADRAAAAVSAVSFGRLRKVRVSVTPTLPPEILACAVERFRCRYPDIKLEFESGFLSDCLPKLLTDKIDLALVMVGNHQRAEFSSLTEEPLFTVDQGVVADAKNRIFDEDADLPELFAKSEWLSTVQDEAFLIECLRKFAGVKPRVLTLCDFYGIDALNGRNNALSLSPLSVVEDSRYAGRLRALDKEKFPLPPLTVSFFWRKAVELSLPGEYMKFAIKDAFELWLNRRPRRYVRIAQ